MAGRLRRGAAQDMEGKERVPERVGDWDRWVASSEVRRAVMRWRGWLLWAPRRSAGHRNGGRGVAGRLRRGAAQDMEGKERVPERVGDWDRWVASSEVRRAVMRWRGWLLWAPCQARGIGRERAFRDPAYAVAA